MHSSRAGLGQTVEGNGDALEQLEAVFALEGGNLAQLADGKVVRGLGILADDELEVVRLGHGLDPDGARLVALALACQS